MPNRRMGERANGRVGEWVSVVKRVCGMPDYHGYLAHMEEKHPGCAVLSEKEFFEVQLGVRYGSGPTRCC